MKSKCFVVQFRTDAPYSSLAMAFANACDNAHTHPGTIITTPQELNQWLVDRVSHGTVKAVEDALTDLEAWDWYRMACIGFTHGLSIVIKDIGVQAEALASLVKNFEGLDGGIRILSSNAD